MPGYNVTRAVTGRCSLTLLFPISIAEELGIRNGETLQFNVSGDRLIVEKKYPNPVTRQTIVVDRDGDDISSLVRSIRKKHANIEKISDFEWEDMENQDSGDVL
jgi:bifunctional DNA-binding transcriptional regulator/antitoxin component of YhaV-PrlF toxin-antitoxin module